LITPYETKLSSVTEGDETKLEARVRNIAPELAIPLRSSAEEVSIGVPADSGLFARLDYSDANAINAETEDRQRRQISCRIIRYDRNGRYGKLRTDEPGNEFGQDEFYFRLASSAPNSVHSNVIDAMHLGPVQVIVTAYRDHAGKIERLVLHDIDIGAS
jgi:hypothetical protein